MRHRKPILSILLILALSVTLFALPAAAGVTGTGSLTTIFATNNSYAGNMFDVQVLASSPVRIDSFDINLSNIGVTATVSVYFRQGTYVGHDNSSDGWVLAGSKTVTSAGDNNATALPVGGIWLAPGETYGFYIIVTDYTASGVHMLYTMGTNTYSNSDMTITCGIGKGESVFTALDPVFAGTTFPSRIWNGTIHYTVGTADILTLASPVEETYTGSDLAATLTDDLAAAVEDVASGVSVTAAFSQGGNPVAEVIDTGTYDVTLTYSVGPAASATTWEQTLSGGAVVAKADQSAPAAPTAQSVTADTVTLAPISDAEYSLNGSTWQTSNEFTGLSPVTEYTFYARLVGTSNLNVSPASDGTPVTTVKLPAPTAPAAPTVSSAATDTVTLAPVPGTEYSLDGVTWQTSNVFSGLTPNTAYTFYARTAETETQYSSPASAGTPVTTDKTTAATPAAPTVQSKATTSITLLPVTGAEYSLDGVTWQASNVISGLKPNTTYTVYLRVAETAAQHASPAATVTVKTLTPDPAPDTGDSGSTHLVLPLLASALVLIGLAAVRLRRRAK